MAVIEAGEDHLAFKVDDLGLRALKPLNLFGGAYGEYPAVLDGDRLGCAEVGVDLNDLAVDED
jgi:hypothetical protein